MKKRVFFTIITFSLIFLLGCGKQDYKRIIVEENVGLERETTLIEPSIPGQIYLEIDSNDYFYPAFYHRGGIYGYLKKGHGNDLISRKYLYKLDVSNKLTETIKENIDFKPGSNNVGFIKDQVYMIDYINKNKTTPIPELSQIINELREDRMGKQYEVSYVSGSNRYLVINEISLNGEITNVFLYDIDRQMFYKNDNDNRYGDICYVYHLRSLIWIDQKDFNIYKVELKNNYYTLEEYIDLGVYKDINRVRGIMKNGYELILFHDLRIGNKDDWNLMETSAVTSFNFKSSRYVYLFNKPIDENLYMEYLGKDIFIAEYFDIFEDYIEPTKRRLYYSNYAELIRVYDEKFQEKSQQLYPEIKVITNEKGNEIFSTREIKKIINGIPTTKNIIYQRIKISLIETENKLEK